MHETECEMYFLRAARARRLFFLIRPIIWNRCYWLWHRLCYCSVMFVSRPCSWTKKIIMYLQVLRLRRLTSQRSQLIDKRRLQLSYHPHLSLFVPPRHFCLYHSVIFLRLTLYPRISPFCATKGTGPQRRDTEVAPITCGVTAVGARDGAVKAIHYESYYESSSKCYHLRAYNRPT